MTEIITGKTLIEMGFKPGGWFSDAIKAAQIARGEGRTDDELREIVARFAPAPVIGLFEAGARPFHLNIRAEGDGEAENIAAVKAHMVELMRVPTVMAGAVMPDACPSDSRLGSIPVGGVIAARDAIHPGMHSADICCSMAVTVFDDADPKAILDAGMAISHFGGGGRRGTPWRPDAGIMDAFEANPFLKPLTSAAIEHFGTQGDGNHFF